MARPIYINASDACNACVSGLICVVFKEENAILMHDCIAYICPDCERKYIYLPIVGPRPIQDVTAWPEVMGIADDCPLLQDLDDDERRRFCEKCWAKKERR